jgi:hypothetical protein
MNFKFFPSSSMFFFALIMRRKILIFLLMKNFCELRNFTKMNFLRRCFKKIFDSPVWTKNMFYCKTALILNFSQKNPTKRIHLRSMLLIIKFFPSTMVWSIKNSHWVASDLFHRFDDFLQLLNCFSCFFHWKPFNAVEWSKKFSIDWKQFSCN